MTWAREDQTIKKQYVEWGHAAVDAAVGDTLRAIADAVVGYAFIQGGLSGAMYRCEKDEAAFALVPVALLDAIADAWNELSYPNRHNVRQIAGKMVMLIEDALTEENDDAMCGAWGGCVLPKGHNMGRVDVPENHEGTDDDN